MINIYQKIFFSFFEKSKFTGVLTIEMAGNKLCFGEALGGRAGVAAVDIRVLDKRFFSRVIINGDIGLGEAYFLNYFETSDLTKLLEWFVQNRSSLPSFQAKEPLYLLFEWGKLFSQIFHKLNKNTKRGSRKNIHKHYDVSNEFYELWLDRTMTYSAAAFEGTDDLALAQENKYRKICEKIQLDSRDHLLEIGSGWGGFAIFAAQNYGCRVTTITISNAQYEYAQRKIREAGLVEKINIFLKDYRDLDGGFDKIVSIEMMEALGHEYVPSFIEKCQALLKGGGKICYQCITMPDQIFKDYLRNNNFIKKYVFPGGELLSLGQLQGELQRRNSLSIDSVASLGLDYAQTLKIWRNNFVSQKEAIFQLGFDQEFYRKWLYYFAYCEAGFKTGYLDDIQILISKR